MLVFAALALMAARPAAGLAVEGCSVLTTSDTTASFFGGTEPGACGTFLVLTEGEGVGPEEESKHVYGPRVPLGPAIEGTGELKLFNGKQEFIATGASQSLLTTVAVLEPTGPETPPQLVAEVTELDTYAPGGAFYSTTIGITNKTTKPLKGTLYHGGDCVLSASDAGYGVKELPFPGSVACTATPNNTPPVRYMALSSPPGSTSGNIGPVHSVEGPFGTMWSLINKEGPQFPDTVDAATFEDNGMGLSWPFVLQKEGTNENVGVVGMITTITPPAPVCPNGPPKVSVTSDQGQIGYQLKEAGSVSITATGQNQQPDGEPRTDLDLRLGSAHRQLRGDGRMRDYHGHLRLHGAAGPCPGQDRERGTGQRDGPGGGGGRAFERLRPVGLRIGGLEQGTSFHPALAGSPDPGRLRAGNDLRRGAHHDGDLQEREIPGGGLQRRDFQAAAAAPPERLDRA